MAIANAAIAKVFNIAFFLPGHSVKKPPNAVAWFATRVPHPSRIRHTPFKANYGAAHFDLNQGRQTTHRYGHSTKQARIQARRRF